MIILVQYELRTRREKIEEEIEEMMIEEQLFFKFILYTTTITVVDDY